MERKVRSAAALVLGLMLGVAGAAVKPEGVKIAEELIRDAGGTVVSCQGRVNAESWAAIKQGGRTAACGITKLSMNRTKQLLDLRHSQNYGPGSWATGTHVYMADIMPDEQHFYRVTVYNDGLIIVDRSLKVKRF